MTKIIQSVDATGLVVDAAVFDDAAAVSADGGEITLATSGDTEVWKAPEGIHYVLIQPATGGESGGMIGYKIVNGAVVPPQANVASPTPQTVFAPRDFINLFTAAEQTALLTSDVAQVRVFVALALAGNVDITNAEVIADIDALVPAGLLTASRAKQILAGQAPTS